MVYNAAYDEDGIIHMAKGRQGTKPRIFVDTGRHALANMKP